MTFVFVLSGWIVSLCLHEFGHAYAAYKGGDRTIAQMGYLSFDPLKYVHPQMTLLMPIIILILGGIGLPGGAVYINTFLIRDKRWVSFSSAAGPLATFAFLIFLQIPVWLGLDRVIGAPEFWYAWSYLALIEVTVLVFNLLPVPGLDGYGIIEPFLPHKLAMSLWSSKTFAPLVLLAVMMLLPPVRNGFWNLTDLLGSLLGLQIDYAYFGMRAFFFWR